MGISSFASTLRRGAGGGGGDGGGKSRVPSVSALFHRVHTSTQTSAKPFSLSKSSASSKPTKVTKHAKSGKPRPVRRARLKDMDAKHLVKLLSSMQAVPPADNVTAITQRIISDDVILTAFIEILTDSPVSDHSPSHSRSDFEAHSDSCTHPQTARARLHDPWLVSALICHGPPMVLDALASHPKLIQKLVSTFDVKSHTLDAARASLISSVLRALLHYYPRETATAIQSNRSIHALVRHVALQPAADLLPLFVATRPFSSNPSAPPVPAHKRAIATIAQAEVHQHLAHSFAKAAAEILDANLSDGLDLRDAKVHVQAAAKTMAEISNRASFIPLKHEDADERLDKAYASNLGIVTASAYNDAKSYLDLGRSPQPVLSLLKVALEDPVALTDSDVVVPVLQMLSALLSQRADSSVSALAELLPQYASQLAEALTAEEPRVGTIRLAAIDTVRAIIQTLDEQSLSAFVSTDHHVIVRALSTVLLRFPNVDMVRVPIVQTVGSLFARFPSVARVTNAAVNFSDVLPSIPRDSGVIEAANAIVTWARAEGHDTILESVDVLIQICERRSVDNDADDWALFGKPALTAKNKQDNEVSSSSTSVSEDFGQELYYMGLLDELSNTGNDTPPTDDFVVDFGGASDVKRWGKGITGLLK